MTAHLFGFLSGLGLEILKTGLVKHPLSQSGQTWLMTLFIGVPALAWLTAFSHG